MGFVLTTMSRQSYQIYSQSKLFLSAGHLIWWAEARADRGGGKPPLLLRAAFMLHDAYETQDSYGLEKMGDVQEYRDYSSIQ